MRPANIVLFAAALGLSFLGAEISGPDFALDAPSPAFANAAACADVAQHDKAAEPALRDLDACRSVP